MSETEKPNEEVTPEETGVEVESPPPARRIHLAMIAAIGVAALLVMFGLVWYFAGPGKEAGRPVPAPRSTNIGEPPAETLANQTLTISPEQIQNAGITIENVGEQLSTESGSTAATGVVEADAYRQTPAMTLIGGIVRRVVPELGKNVSAGQTVAVVFSDEFAQTQSRYIALLTERENARRNYERTQRLVTINQPGHSELEQATKQRKAAEASLSEMHNRYDRTTKLIRIGAASREELEQDNTKLKTAEAELDEARLREQRAGQLLPISSEVRSANEEALNKLRSAETEASAVRQRLILYGMSSGRVDSLRNASQITSELAVPAPASGTVTSRSVNPGEVVEANKELLKITDLSNVWVIAQIYERDLGRLREGTGATITSDTFPEKVFRGHVMYIDPQLDETTRAAKVRIEVANPGQALKLGMYVKIALASQGTAERTTPVIPTSAVQPIGDQQIVFVATSDGNTFELRPIRLGAESNGKYQVLEGLTVGDRIVTNGSFTLRAEWQKSRQGAEHQH